MRFRPFKSLKRIGRRSTQAERVFAEASELAQRGLERCIADLQTRLATMKEMEGPISEETVGPNRSARTAHA